MLRRTMAALAAVLAAAGLAAGCGSDDDSLTLYSGRGESLVGPILDRFTEETGIDVEVRYGDTADLALLIDEEGSDTPADVYWSQSPGATQFLADRGHLAPLPPGVLESVDPRFEDDDGLWVGVSGRQRVLVYNRDMVEESELPESVLDVNDPPLRGRVAVAPTNGSFQDFVTALRRIEGEEAAARWLEGLAEAGAPTYANNNAIVEAVGRGEVPMGLVNHYYNHRFLEEDPGLPSRNHRFADGDVGGLVIPSAMSVTEGSERSDEAERLIRFMLSDEAQRYFAEETFEYPLAQGVAAAEGVPPLASLEPPEQAPDGLADIDDTARIIAESGLN